MAFSREFLGLIGGSFLCLLLPALAQTPPDAGTLLRQQEQLQQRTPGQLPAREAEASRPPLKVGAGETVRVKAIRFSGATVLVPEAELQSLVADAIGRDLDFAALQQLAQRITSHLKSRGWFLARAYLPAQDITSGVIEIALLAGRLSQREPVRITPGGKLALRIDPERLAAIAERHLPASVVAREEQLNRTVLLMNDLPGLSARARLEPGDDSGETRVILTLDEGPLLSGNISADNYGSRDTGTEQINASLDVNDPLGLGDRLSLAAAGSEGTTTARLAYSLPLGSDGLKMNLGYTDLRYDVRTATGRAAGLGGESQTVSAGISYPWLRSRTANLYASLVQTHKELVDRSNTGILRDKQVDTSTLTLSGDRLDNLGGGGLSSFSLWLTSGTLGLDLPVDAAADATGYRTAGGYHKLGYNVGRLQKLPGAFTLFANLTGQQAGKNLDSSEKLYLGGPAGVRAYPGSEAGSDSGQILNLELRYDWPEATPLGLLQMQAFYDTGWANLHHDTLNLPIATATSRNRYRIAGAGFGLSIMKPGSHVVRASLASKVGSNPGRSVQGNDADGLEDTTRLWLQAILFF
jgi:hemolysin activation/secretion protein